MRKPIIVTHARVVPCGDDNYVRVGDMYEFLYWDNSKWISQGTIIAQDNKLVYDSIPHGALMWLRNLTRGMDERCFLIRKMVLWSGGKKYDLIRNNNQFINNMILRKVTRRIVFSTAAMLAVGFVNISCSNEEFEGSQRTLATRTTVGAEFGDNEAPRIAWVNAGAVTDGDSIHDFYSQLKFKIEWGAGFVGTTQDIPSRVNFCTDENSVRIVKLHNKEGEYDTRDTILSKNVQWGGMGEDYMELSFSIIADHIIYYYDQMEKKNKEYVEHYVINETKTINAVVKPMNEFE